MGAMAGLDKGLGNVAKGFDPVTGFATDYAKGSKGLDLYGEKAKKDAEKYEAESQKRWDEYNKTLNPEAEETHAPDAEKANVNLELQQRSNARKRFLLQQSTGREPNGPQIQPQQKTLL